MDYTDLTTTQLTALSNAFMQVNMLMEDDLPDNFPSMLAEYLAMAPDERLILQQDLSVQANDLKDMSAKQLEVVKTSGVAGLSKLLLSK